MKLERHFLDWHSPALPAVADFFLQRSIKDGVCDLSRFIVVTPSRRAGRRLQELLAWHAEQWKEKNASSLLFIPPHTITTGQLPEQLIYSKQPVADDLQTLSAWAKALQETPAPVLQRLFEELPATDDYLGWWSLAHELYELHRELSADGVSYEEVKQYCAAFDITAAARWKTLQTISANVQEQLCLAGFIDRDTAVQRALQSSNIRCDDTIVLLSTVDLNLQTRRLLQATDCNVIVLIHASPENEAGFGELGELVPEYWQQRTIPLRDEQIHPVERSVDQVAAVVDVLQSLKGVPGDCIAIGMGDEKLAPMLERALEHQGRASHRAVATDLAQTPPLRLLVLLAEFVADARPRNFQQLLLHPDFGDWLERRLAGSLSGKDLQTHTDQYLAECLPMQMTLTSFNLPPELKLVLEAIDGLVPSEQNKQLPVGDWVSLVRLILETIYEDKLYTEELPGESGLFRAFEALGGLLEEITRLSESRWLSPYLSFSGFIRFLMQLAQGKTLPQQGMPDAVELIGWLELHLDDAPVLIITNFNEALIPENVHVSPFLTDSLRSRFNLLDNNRRYARDAYLLTAILHSRQKLDVIFAGHSQQNDPLQPSRLLFACEPETLRQRVQQYYRETNAGHGASAPFLSYGRESGLSQIPRPQPLPEPITRLNVTAFRSYLECPYRFYLQHVQGLGVVYEIAVEMEARSFGILLHQVLSDFAVDTIADRDWMKASEEQIAQRLNQLLERTALNLFGKARMASIEIQLHQAQRRLQAFARNQKAAFESGWMIYHSEQKLDVDVDVDGTPFNIYGRVDRIDFHAESGQYRILDYKVGDALRKPEQSHRAGPRNDKQWIDLQLPLYRLLAAKLEIEPTATQVGYFGLPAELGHKGLEMAGWTNEDFYEAQEIAFEVIRQLRRQIFWPPAEVKQPVGDTIGAICRDADPRRRQA